MVTDAENSTVIAIPSGEEIHDAIKSMDLDNASGPDGFSGHFFISCWDVVGSNVTLAVQHFFKFGSLPATFNSSLITLIHKVENAD